MNLQIWNNFLNIAKVSKLPGPATLLQIEIDPQPIYAFLFIKNIHLKSFISIGENFSISFKLLAYNFF